MTTTRKPAIPPEMVKGLDLLSKIPTDMVLKGSVTMTRNGIKSFTITKKRT